MSEKKIHIITVGCPKNQVDSEELSAQLKANGYSITSSLESAEVAVINTCGFIDAAKQESIETILRVAERKKSNGLKKVIVTGCLVERYKKELREGLHEVDAFYGTNEIGNVLKEFGAEYKYEMLGERLLSSPGHYAYLKISEGCDNPCSFCAIPLMRGKHVSKPLEQVVHEAELLAQKGVKELIVIGQDTTYYGLDIYGKRELPELMTRLNKLDGIEWIRLMYAYPAKFPEELLDVIRDGEKICKYIDIPIQHVSDDVLRSMRRGITRRKLEELLYKIRESIPGVAIRTTLIVGYPAEGEREFEELIKFVEEFKFDRLGAFTYSPEDGTTASILGDPVPQDEKERRHAAIMEAQRQIIEELNGRKIGKTLKVLVDKNEGDNCVGRTSHDAPEIDTEVIFNSKSLPGEFVNIKIHDAHEHDLYGV
ncbi:MAG TPA: 30S ribosomal protein S12 methylthiotransferase RimO [Candidatus Acidoferrales bacterium]|nr:30S ribosomal protein S12 methylthiotransferase RimO [Candidatus Acidoferrales bacterium]